MARMKTPTVWPARRVGWRILCGRPAPGRGFCSGEIATVEYSLDIDRATDETIVLDPGWTEDPPGSGTWRPTARAKRQLARGQIPNNLRVDPSGFGPLKTPALPWRRRCPVCAVLAEVTVDLLSS